MRIGQKNLDFVKVVPMKTVDGRREAAGTPLILYEFVDVKWGRMLLAATEVGVCYAGFVSSTEEALLADMRKRFGGFDVQEGWNIGLQQAWTMLAVEDKPVELVCLHLKGTDFQLRVWMELLQIPFGKTVSYKQIAMALQCPGACRAVGTAIGSNPISVLIPCHRVLRQDGGLGGYHWGLIYKRRLLETEGIIDVTGLQI